MIVEWEGLKAKAKDAALRPELKTYFEWYLAANWPAILAQYERGQRGIEAAKKMRSDFVTAIALRESQCRNSDVENEGGNPLNWDKILMQWSATLAEFEKEAKI